MRVFISSTCYDLIDLRAEIADFLRQAGVDPVLSDDPTSDFHSKTDANSIEACLANVRSCDAYIIILSNRYGPKLNTPPYGGKSATHLEYEEAVRTGKPIWMYVRDKTEGEFALWKRNRGVADFESAWVLRKDWGVFDLLESHRALPEEKLKANWFTIFKDSLELKKLLKKDFSAVFARAVADSLFNSGRIPFLEVRGHFNLFQVEDANHYIFPIANLSNAPAISPLFELFDRDSGELIHREQLPGIYPQTETVAKLQFMELIEERNWSWKLTYSILEGHKFQDSGTADATWKQHEIPMVKLALIERRYLSSASEMLLKA